MHELSIMQSVVEICAEYAAGRRVRRVVMEVGGLSGVVPLAAEFCFEACSKGTDVEGATLVIEQVQPEGSCSLCGGVFPVASYYDPCPSCGSFAVSVTAGDELRVREMEVDD